MALREQTQRLLSQEDVTADNVEEMYGIEGIDLPDITAKDVGMFVAESTPIVGEAIALKRTSDALDEGDYVGAGIEATAGLLGLVPGVGDAAGKALRATTRRLRKDAKLEIDNPGFDEVYQETYAETKQRASDKVKNKAIEAGQRDTYEANIGTAGGITGYANDVKFDPKELEDIPGAMGEEKFRSSDGYGKLELLEKSIAEKGYKPYNILIHVREDGQPFIVEGNHRLAEALKSGRESITADVRYLRGAEEKAGPLDPRNIFPDQMVDDAPAPRMGYDPNNESSRVFHLTKADFDTADVIGSGTSDIGFHVGTAQQATARGSTQTNYDPELAEQMVKGERILPMVLKADLKPARIVDMSNFKVPGSWLANLSVASSDLQRIKFLKGDESDAALFAKAPKVKVDGETYTMLPDAMRAGVDEDLWRDIVIEAHDAKRRGLDTINSQEDRIAWFNTLKETANKNGYDSFVYRNEYEGTANENIDELVEQIQRAQRGEIDPAEIDMNSRFADSYMLLEPNQVKGLFGGMTESSPEFMKNKGGLMLQKGGAVPMKEQMEMFEDGGLEQDGGTKDPVSGNDVPPGSAQEEVRDDIPAQLSEGEFVFPADVVRYIGLEKLMMMRQEAKMGLKMMEEMGQMGNSDEATIPDDLPFGITDLIIVDGSEGVDNDEDKEYNTGGIVFGNNPNTGVTYQAPQFQAGQTQVGMAASPIEMAPISRPVQQETPVYQPPETLPDPGEFVSAPEGQAPQTIVIVNKETGEERTITFIPGVTEIPEGFVRKEDYVPKEVVPETPTTTVQTERVLDDPGKEDDDARRRQALIDQYGNASARIGLLDFDGPGNSKTYGVNYMSGMGAGFLGIAQAMSGKVPDDARIMLKDGADEIILTGAEWKTVRAEIKEPGTDYTKTRQIFDTARERVDPDVEAKREQEEIIFDDQGNAIGVVDKFASSIEKAKQRREIEERREAAREAQRKKAADEAARRVREEAERERVRRAQEEDVGSRAREEAFGRRDDDSDTGFERGSIIDTAVREAQEMVDSGYFDENKGGLMSNEQLMKDAVKKSTKKKKMKRGGLASKKQSTHMLAT